MKHIVRPVAFMLGLLLMAGCSGSEARGSAQKNNDPAAEVSDPVAEADSPVVYFTSDISVEGLVILNTDSRMLNMKTT